MSGRQVSVNTDASTGYFHIADIDIKTFELRTQTRKKREHGIRVVGNGSWKEREVEKF